MKRWVRAGALAGLLPMVLATAGCTSTPPAPAEYLLRPALQETVRAVEQTPQLALGRVSLPPYLERDGIVLETGDRRVQAARDHRWAEPLSRALRRMLQTGVARASGRSVADLQNGDVEHVLVIDVDVHQFHGTVNGTVTLAADWALRDQRTGRVLQRHEFVRRTPTRERGYDALVAAHASLLDELAEAIAAALPGPG